jgi:phage-related protein
MGEAADIILTYEEGAFSMFVTANTFDVLLNTFAKLLLILFNAIVQIAKYFAQLVEALYSKSLDIISKLPKWFIAGLLSAISIALIALSRKEFRDRVTSFFNELWETFEPIIRKLINTFYDLFKIIYSVIKDLIVWIASMSKQMAPYFIIMFGILMDRMYKLFKFSHHSSVSYGLPLK